ncbi:hypothetical protein L7F22_066512 [Adiantum nelumboides]|nr:hypothetical protein [Adiantum nelumboides]
MPKPTNPLWKEHTNVIEVVNTPGQAKTGCRKWSCKYCGFTMSSTITRVVMHQSGINCTNNCSKCKMVPPGVREALNVEKFPAFATTDKGKVAQQTQDRLQDALLGQLGDSSTQMEESLGRDDILFFIESRWKFMSRPIHGMAALLHLFYKTLELFHESDLLTLKNEYVNDLFEEQKQLAIDAEMCKYMNNLGPSFSRQAALRQEATSCPLTWWQSYGRQGLPCLTTMALRLLSQWSVAGRRGVVYDPGPIIPCIINGHEYVKYLCQEVRDIFLEGQLTISLFVCSQATPVGRRGGAMEERTGRGGKGRT